MRRFVVPAVLLLALPACSAGRLALPDLRGALAAANAMQAPPQVISDHPAALVPTPKPSPSPSWTPPPAATQTITGTLRAPAGVVSNHTSRVYVGGNVVGMNVGNVIGMNVGNVVSQAGGSLVGGPGATFALAAVAEAGVADVAIYAATADGTPREGAAVARSGADGAFTLVVPADGPLVVQADVLTKAGRPATMQTLWRPGASAAPVSLASTCMAVAVTRAGKLPANLQVADWERGVALTAAQLFPGQWPDLADRQAIAAKMDDLAQATPELADVLKRLK